MSEQIKPCPFCGRVITAPGEGPSLVSDCNDYRYVTCPCGADGPEHDDDDEAIVAWNAAPRFTPAERAVLDAAVNRGEHLLSFKRVPILGPMDAAIVALARERRGGGDGK